MEKCHGVIYKATNKINGKAYIGQTIRCLSGRIACHVSNSLLNKDESYFHRALKKYGSENFEWEIIGTYYSLEELNEMEKYFIEKFDTFNNGYNLTVGGEGTTGFKQTEATKEKIRCANRGCTRSVEFKKKISKAMKGANHPMYGKKGESNPLFGRKHSTETKIKMSNAHKGKKLSADHRHKLSNTKRKNYVITTPVGALLFVHGIRDFCRIHDLDHSSLIKVARGKLKYYKGYKCEYVEGHSYAV